MIVHKKISKFEFDKWVLSPITQNFFKFLEDIKENMEKEMLDLSYQHIHGNVEGFERKIAFKHGYIVLVEEVLSLVFEEENYKEEENG